MLPVIKGWNILIEKTVHLHFLVIPLVAETYEGLDDPEEIIDLIKNNKKVGFLYLSPAVPKSSVKYHYYNLK